MGVTTSDVLLHNSVTIKNVKVLYISKNLEEISLNVPLATDEAEIRKIMFQSHPWEIVHKTLSQKYPSQKKGRRHGSNCRVPAW
jgi:hypothetical protein